MTPKTPPRGTKSSTPKTTTVKASAKRTQKSKPYISADNLSQLPMTSSQSIKWGKLNMSPKTSTTLFTTPKGTSGLSQKEIDAIQRRRILDRKRTLARAKNIIRRDY